MIGACTIDGTDIATLGMFILRGGDNDFIAYPERKEPIKNDWFEHDGIEVDFTSLTFKPKTLKVDYYLAAPDTTLFNYRLNAFKNLHFAQGLRAIYVREFGRTFNLQFVGANKMEHKGGLWKDGRKTTKLTIEYVDNNPLALFEPAVLPLSGTGTPTRVLLNGTDMAAYGIIIRDFYSTALNMAKPKKGIDIETQFTNGSIADVAFTPKKQGRKLSMECNIISDTLLNFWNDYSALFNELAKQEPLVLALVNGMQISCYYSGMASLKKLRPFNTKIHLSFTLNFNEL